MTEAQKDDLDALAGEYVLGSLDRDETTRVGRRLETDPALRNAIAFWQDRLLPLALSVEPVQPAPAHWAAIEQDLRGSKAATNARPQWSLWDSVRFWRWASALAAAGVCVLAYIAVLLTEEPGAAFIAVLTAPDRSPGWVVRAEPGRPLHLTPLVEVPAEPNRSLQFWTLVDKAKGPVSLGLVSPGRPLQVAASSLPGLATGQLFEITSEPYGGSPVGRPTGAVLYKGLAVRSP